MASPAAAAAHADAAATADANGEPPSMQQQPWRRARVETTIKLSTTGGTVWGAAEAAIAFFERHWDALVAEAGAGSGRPTRVLELGAGCGKLGLTLALNKRGPSGVSVLLTEQPGGGALEHLERNVRLNMDGDDGDGTTTTTAAPPLDARAAACDWADFLSEEAGGQQTEENDDDDDDDDERRWRACERVSPSLLLPRADVIVGSDLIYLSEGAHALPRAIAALLRRGRPPPPPPGGLPAPAPVAYYAHTRHRFDALDVEFEEQCAACGLELRELDAGTGAPVDAGKGGGECGALSSSPPPFTELFPEHRVAIYRLRLLEEEEG